MIPICYFQTHLFHQHNYRHGYPNTIVILIPFQMAHCLNYKILKSALKSDEDRMSQKPLYSHQLEFGLQNIFLFYTQNHNILEGLFYMVPKRTHDHMSQRLHSHLTSYIPHTKSYQQLHISEPKTKINQPKKLKSEVSREKTAEVTIYENERRYIYYYVPPPKTPLDVFHNARNERTFCYIS